MKSAFVNAMVGVAVAAVAYCLCAVLAGTFVAIAIKVAKALL